MAKNDTITHARLCEVLHYDPETGIFTNRIKRGAAKVGDIVGGKNGAGYIQFTIDGVFFYGHIAAWFWMTGSMPSSNLDHENLDKSDNMWRNIRPATQSQNCWNFPIAKNNTSGFKGVSRCKRGKPWHAYIWVGDKRVWNAYFETAEEAADARARILPSFHGEFARQG